MASEITIKKGESKTYSFLIKRNGVAYNMSSLDPAPTFKWAVKVEREDSSYILEKLDAAFDKADLSTGYVHLTITASDTAALEPGSYVSELKSTFTTDDIDKSTVIDFILKKSVIHD
jgi:hypothetical protein